MWKLPERLHGTIPRVPVPLLGKRGIVAIPQSHTPSRVIDVPVPPGLSYMPFQIEGITFHVAHKDSLNAGEMGCVDGEAEIQVNRAGLGRRYKLKDAYKRFHGLDRLNWNWDKSIPTYCKALAYDELRQHRVKDILFKGTRETVKVTLLSGKSVIVTPDHEILTTKGWVEAALLTPEHDVLTNGTPKFRFVDTDGYVRIKRPDHHRADSNGYVYEHIVVLERELKRTINLPLHVHHVDGNRSNNDPSNLQLLTPSEHHRVHGKHMNLNGGRAGNGGAITFVPKPDKVLSVTPCGEREVYDVVMEDPHRNFVANGIIVHNCGKTIQAIGLYNYLQSQADHVLKMLVICPASLRLNWATELKKWLVEERTIGVCSTQNTKRNIARWAKKGVVLSKDWPVKPFFGEEACEIIVVNYDILDRYLPHVHATQWDILCVDEVHMCRNADTRRSRAVFGYTPSRQKRIKSGEFLKKEIQAERRIFLTGTPIMNRPKELWPLLRSLDPKEFGSFYSFGHKYCNPKRRGGSYDFSGASNLDELHGHLKRFMIRHRKEDVLKDLPPKRRQILAIPSDKYQHLIHREKEVYKDHKNILKELSKLVELSKASSDPEAYKAAVQRMNETRFTHMSEMSKIRHETALAKVPHVIEHVRSAVEQSGKVVVFAHHRDVIELIAQHFGADCVVVHGSVSLANRQEAVDQFQNGKVPVFIGQIQAAGVGITLTASSHVIFAELDWVPANMSQSEDRLHRHSQKNSVLVQHVVLDGSLDHRMATKLIEKQAVIDQAVDGRQNGKPRVPQIGPKPTITFEP